MAISVIFCVGSQSYIKAQAIEWAVPTITAGEAIKWLLGLLGVTVAGGALANTDWDQLAENYSTYAHNQGLTAVETGKFWEDVIDGSLDTGSKAWTKFKEWVQTLPSQITANLNSYTMNEFASSLGVALDNPLNYDLSNFKLNFIFVYGSSFPTNYKASTFYLFNATHITTSSAYVHIYYTQQLYLTKVNDNLYKISSFTTSDTEKELLLENTGSAGSYWGADYLLNNLSKPIYFPNVIPFPFPQGFSKFMNDVSNIGLIVSNAISDAIPDVIPLPWDQVAGTAEGINDKINELIEKVNEGVLSLEDYMVAIQSILGVIAFDTTNDLVIPANPDLPDKTIQDKINENIDNNGFVLTGLENFFPFCIPFDIYSFITILVAEPVAPVIHWHIYNPVTKNDNIIDLDFSVWEPIVILFRYIFDFLFIIGLAMIARSLIGGDD